jgi:uncharacterized RDD family membrane protein YckC
MSVTLSYTAAGDATYATFWRRLAAYVIDALLLFLPSLLIVAAWQYEMLPRGPVSPAELRLWRQVVGITVAIVYSTGFEGGVGATPGKMLMGIKVLDADGNPLGFVRAAARNVFKLLSAILLMIGYLMVFWTAKKQALHDMMAYCVVVRTAR